MNEKPLTKPIAPHKDPAVGAKTTFYRHCTVTKGQAYMQTWLPAKFAILGEVLKLKKYGKWDDGWTVTTVGDNLIDQYYLDGIYNQWKHHTDVSDI